MQDDSTWSYVYLLRDPITRRVRYVGQSNNPKRRLRAHLSQARRVSTLHSRRWIASLLAKGVLPVLEVIEQAENVCERETFWIAFYNACGCDLTNLRESEAPHIVSAETRAKQSAAKLGKPPWNKGRKTPPDVRAKQHASALRRFERPDQREQMQETCRRALAVRDANAKERGGYKSGWHHTAEARAKISAASKGNTNRLGEKCSEEQCRQMSEVQKRRWGRATDEERKRTGEWLMAGQRRSRDRGREENQ